MDENFVRGFTRFLDSLDDAFAEYALRPDQQDCESQHEGEPVFNAAADQRPEVGFRQFFSCADDQSADNGARHRGKAADYQNRQRFQGKKRDRELHAELGTPDGSGDQRHKACDQPHDEPDPADRNADRLGRGVIVRDGAERAAGFCPLEENGETRDQKSGDQAAPDIELVDEDAARKQALQREPCVRRVQLERIDVRSERQLGRAFNDKCGADGLHE